MAATHRFTVQDVDRMVETGVLDATARVELVDGELIDVNPQAPEHATLKDELRDRLAQAYGSSAHVRDQVPLALGMRDLPEPDLAVVRGARRDFLHRHPTGADVILVVEVSQSSARHDRRKAARYARGGVPCYWQLDLDTGSLVVRVEPVGDRYTREIVLLRHDDVCAPGLEVRLRVADLLP
jgi:Uma2 family endonuclease